VGGKAVTAGTYAIVTLPTKKGWTFILSKATDLDGNISTFNTGYDLFLFDRDLGSGSHTECSDLFDQAGTPVESPRSGSASGTDRAGSRQIGAGQIPAPGNPGGRSQGGPTRPAIGRQFEIGPPKLSARTTAAPLDQGAAGNGKGLSGPVIFQSRNPTAGRRAHGREGAPNQYSAIRREGDRGDVTIRP
jgi:hypothetical protein